MNTINNQKKVTIPSFDLQSHYHRISVPLDLDLRQLSRQHLVFPLRVVNSNGRKRLLLAMRDPYNQTAITDVEFRVSMAVIPVQADEIDIQWLIQKFYYGRELTPPHSYKPIEVIHDFFEQLAICSDEQDNLTWETDLLKPFGIDGN